MATKTRTTTGKFVRNLEEISRYSLTTGWGPWEPNAESYDRSTRTQTVDAVFSRPKPSPLTNTAMQVEDDQYLITPNHTSGPVRVGYSRFRRSGTKFFCLSPSWAGSVGKYTVTVHKAPTSGDALVALARSRFVGSHAQFGETLMELRSTASGVHKRGRQIARLAQQLKSPREIDRLVKSGKLTKAMGDRIKSLRPWESSKGWAKAWLEVQFLWLQLFQDIYAALDYSSNKLIAGQEVRKSSFSVDSESGAFNRAGWSGVVKNAQVANLTAYGLANPALTAWQLTRLSFIADWFVNVSSVLSGLGAFAGLTVVRGYKLESTVQLGTYANAGTVRRTRLTNREALNGFAGHYFSALISRETRDAAGKMLTLAAVFRTLY